MNYFTLPTNFSHYLFLFNCLAQNCAVKKLKRKLFPGKSRLEKRGEYNLVESFKDHAEMTSIRKKFTNLSKSTSTSSSSTSSTSSSSTSSSTIATTKVDDAVQLEEEDRVGYVDDEEDDYDDQDKYELMEVFGNAFTELHEKKSQNTSLTPISIDTFTDTDDDNDENECYPGVDLNESDDDFDMHLNGLMPRDYHYDPVASTERTILGPFPNDSPSKKNHWAPCSSPQKNKSNSNSKSSMSNHHLTPPKQNKSKKHKQAHHQPGLR